MCVWSWRALTFRVTLTSSATHSPLIETLSFTSRTRCQTFVQPQASRREGRRARGGRSRRQRQCSVGECDMDLACGRSSAVRIWLVLHGCHLSGAKIPLRSGAKSNGIAIKRRPAFVGHCGAKQQQQQQQLLHLCQQDVLVKLTPSLQYYYIYTYKSSVVYIYVCVCVNVTHFFCVATKC